MSASETIAASLGNITSQVIAESMKDAEVQLGKMLQEAEKKIEHLFTKRPCLDIVIGNSKPVKLSKKPALVLPRCVVNAKLGLNTLLVGPAGCGKTTAAYQVAESFGLQFGSVCLTAGASETWLFGRQTPTGFIEGMFSKIYREGGVFLADEIDAADANLLLSINTALSHDEMLNPMNGQVIKKHREFIFIAAANTNGKGATHLYTGRSRLDAATLDRFVLVDVTYDNDIERSLCGDSDMFTFLNETRAELIKQGYDEFISTRSYQYCSLQLEAGVTPLEIKNSLVYNWSDLSKEVANTIFGRLYTTSRASKSKTGTPYSQRAAITAKLEEEGSEPCLKQEKVEKQDLQFPF